MSGVPVPHATGYREDSGLGLGIVVERRFNAPIQRIWEAVATPEGLRPWIGDYSGDPASGLVRFRMAYEGEYGEPNFTRILECRAPERVHANVERHDDDGGITREWGLTLDLSEAEGVTTLKFAHLVPSADWAPDYGPGWDYYLDRLVAVINGEDPARVDFNAYHPGFAQHYREAFGLADQG